MRVFFPTMWRVMPWVLGAQVALGDGDVSKVQALLKKADRPTMAEVIAAGEPGKKSLLEGVSLPHYVYGLARTTHRVAFAIAVFERAFPGATWYALGRDAAYLGDVLDAFYLSLGQQDRVRRLDASHPSFRAGSDKLVQGFLRTNGISFEQIDALPPQVIFDTTSFSKDRGVGGGASQSVRLIRAGYRAWAALGKDPKALIPKYNFISVGGMWGEQEVGLEFDFEKFFDTQRQSTTREGFARPLYVNLGEFTYTREWHGIFEPFEKAKDGRVYAPRGYAASDYARREILAEMWETWRIVSSKEFLKSVQRWSRLLGYEFPLSRRLTLTAVSPVAQEQARQEMKDEQARLAAEAERIAREQSAQKREMRNRRNQLSPAGIEYMDRLEERLGGKDLKPQAAVEALRFVMEDIPVAEALTDADLLCLMKTALATVYTFDNKPVVAYLAQTVRRSPRLWHLLTQTRLEEDAYGDLGFRVSGNYMALMEALGLSVPKAPTHCADELLGFDPDLD